MQSNLAIFEELNRIAAYLDVEPEAGCPNKDCEQHNVAVGSTAARYKRFGKTAADTPRYRCLKCQTTFSKAERSVVRQRMAYKNKDVFLLLVNKSALRRIAAVTELSMDTVYRKIHFIHKQCMRFVGERERVLTERDWPTRYITVDRQTFMVNWLSRKDRRNVNLLAIDSADLETGYVFGMHLNFNGAMDADTVIADMARFGDHKLARPFRRYARVWLPQDYEDAAKRHQSTGKATASKGPKQPSEQLEDKISDTYAGSADIEGGEASDTPSGNGKAPPVGMQVHEQCSMNAHIQLVARLLRRAKKLRFFLDQEPGLQAAVMAAVPDRIKDRTADAYFVSVLKEVSTDDKRKAMKAVNDRFNAAKALNPTLKDWEIGVRLMKEEMKRTKVIGNRRDRWLAHPMPNMSEPAKNACWLTDMGDYDDDHAARLYLKATLHPVDRFFMQVRRRLSLAERPIASAANKVRVWNGYSAYQPANLVLALEIFRDYYNYCQTGEDKK